MQQGKGGYPKVRQCKQRIKGFLLYLGHKETAAIRNRRSDCEEQIAALPLLPEGRLTIESHLRELRFFQQELSEVAKQFQHLNRQAEHRTVIKSLTSVPGVGIVVATSFHMELFRPERFQRGEEVASYLGSRQRFGTVERKRHAATWPLAARNSCDPC